ncbi:MAG: TonB family protein [Candidatus Aegiribacteria sp.]
MTNIALCLLIFITGQAATVDQAIELYLMGDMRGSISALESLLDRGGLTLDEEVRAYHRLGAAYYGLGETDNTEDSFYSLLILDPYYDLGPWENPELRSILNDVRQENLATVLIQGEPRGALVFLQDQYLGSTPFIHDNLIGGQSYTFTIMAEGYRTSVKTCSVAPGQLHTLTYQMESESSPGTGTLAGREDVLAQVESRGHDTQFPDTSSAAGQDGSGSMSIERLNALLHGGEEMAALEDVGPLNMSSSENEDQTSGREFTRDRVRFESTGGTIETDSRSGARMVFSDVNVESEEVLQTAPGATYGSRSSGEVRGVLASKESAVTFIYNKHLRSDPLLSGTVVIEMIIQPSGRVSDVRIIDSNTMNPAFDLELAANVETWRFGAVDEDEGPLPVTYPFVFSR